MGDRLSSTRRPKTWRAGLLDHSPGLRPSATAVLHRRQYGAR